MVREVAERRSERHSPIGRVRRLDERNVNNVGATFAKHPPELAGPITSNQHAPTSERSASISVARHGQFSAA